MAKNTEKKPPALKGVSAAERALAVLTAFRRGDSALSLAELAERTGLVKSTILRLALSLQQYRLLARLPDGSYRLDAGGAGDLVLKSRTFWALGRGTGSQLLRRLLPVTCALKSN